MAAAWHLPSLLRERGDHRNATYSRLKAIHSASPLALRTAESWESWESWESPWILAVIEPITHVLNVSSMRRRICCRRSTITDQPKEKASVVSDGGFSINSLTMSYFHTGTRTIIGAEAFHGPVRDGKEWDHLAMVIRHNFSPPALMAGRPIRRVDRLGGKSDS